MGAHFSRVRLFEIPWSVARQALLSMGFSRQVYWSGLPGPPAGDLLDPGIKPTSHEVSCIAGGFFTAGATKEAHGLLSWRLPHAQLRISN